jgi:hypothetical protein
MKPEDLEIGSLKFTIGRQSHTLQMLQLALNNDKQVTLVSFVGPQSATKAVATAFNAGVGVSCQSPHFREACLRSFPGKGRYNIRRHRLEYGLLQATLWLKQPQFLPAYSEEALWRRLSSDEFTTPVLREWVPWLGQAMIAHDPPLLRFDTAFQCKPAHLILSPHTLDNLVELGIQKGQLTIPGDK